MATFSDLKFGPRVSGGVRARHFFPNGYGVSVIRGYGTYGSDAGLYEMAVLRGSEADWDLDYTTPVTDDVLGHLDEAEITRLLSEVEALSPPTRKSPRHDH